MTSPEPFAQHRSFSRPLIIVMRAFSCGHEAVVDPSDTRQTVINDIRTGQIDRVVSVTEVYEGRSTDITDVIRDAVENYEGPDPMRGVEFPFAKNH
jgi:hypothetical protein